MGFEPEEKTSFVADVNKILKASVEVGWKQPAIRWSMLAAPFTVGTGFYMFYAMQPHLLELYGNSEAYLVAGLAAALVAGAQIIGGTLVPHIMKLFKKRTSILLMGVVLNVVVMIAAGLTSSFWLTIVLLSIWGLTFTASMPVRQGYLNSMIPSKKRATVLSVDAMFGSGGGAVIQPALGRAADLYSYGMSFIVSGAVVSLALPFYFLAKREKTEGDIIKKS